MPKNARVSLFKSFVFNTEEPYSTGGTIPFDGLGRPQPRLVVFGHRLPSELHISGREWLREIGSEVLLGDDKCRKNDASFTAKSNHRIHLRGAPSGNVTGQERNRGQQRNHAGKRSWIGRAYAVKKTRQPAR